MQRLWILLITSAIFGCTAARPPAQTQLAASNPETVIVANLPFAAVSLVAAERQPMVWTPTPHFAIDHLVDITLVGESEEATAGNSGRTGHFQTDLQSDEATLTWEFGGGATLDSTTETAAYVTFGDPGTYTGTLIANASGRETQHPFEYVVVPNVRGIRIADVLTIIPRNKQIKLTVELSHAPASVIEWRLPDKSAPLSATGESIMASFTAPGPGGAPIAVRTGDSEGRFGGWREFTLGLEVGPQATIEGGITIPSGKEGDVVTGQAHIKQSYDRLEWDFQGGATWVGGTELAPRVMLGRPGTYTASLLAITGTSTAWTRSTFTVESRSPYDWQRMPLLLKESQVIDPVATVLDGKPVISWEAHDTKPPEHWIAIARSVVPRTPDDWLVYPLGIVALPAYAPRHLIVHDGRLHFLTDSGEKDLVWASAQVENPRSAKEWTIRHVPGSQPTQFGFIGNRPIYSATSGVDLLLHQGLVSDPATATDWTSLLVPVKADETSARAPEPLFFELDNRLIVPYDTEWGLHILIADSNVPTSLDQLSAYQLGEGHLFAGVAGFVVQNRLLLWSTSSGPVDGSYAESSMWFHAQVAVPESAGDWMTAPFLPKQGAPNRSQGLLINDRPALISRSRTWGYQTLLYYAAYDQTDLGKPWIAQGIGKESEFGGIPAIALETAAGPLLIQKSAETGQVILLYPK